MPRLQTRVRHGSRWKLETIWRTICSCIWRAGAHIVAPLRVHWSTSSWRLGTEWISSRPTIAAETHFDFGFNIGSQMLSICTRNHNSSSPWQVLILLRICTCQCARLETLTFHFGGNFWSMSWRMKRRRQRSSKGIGPAVMLLSETKIDHTALKYYWCLDAGQASTPYVTVPCNTCCSGSDCHGRLSVRGRTHRTQASHSPQPIRSLRINSR